MINRIWSLKQLWLQVNGHAWFHLHGSAKLFGTGRERKIQMKNICLQRDSNPRHATPQQVNQRFRPLGHEALTSYRIVGYKLIRPLRDNTCQIDYRCMFIWTDCQTKSACLISMLILASILTIYRILHWLSNHSRWHTCIVTCPFVFINQDTVRLQILLLISNQCGRAV